jgi:hypothetical protein
VILQQLWPGAGVVSPPDSPRRVAHPLRPRHQRIRLRPRLLPLAMIGERPRSLPLGDDIVDRSLGVRWGEFFCYSGP